VKLIPNSIFLESSKRGASQTDILSVIVKLGEN
jgi:hypothetical protein